MAYYLESFIYWGWDSGVAVNEESENASEGPGRAAVLSTIVLVLVYVVVATAAQAFHGTAFLGNNANDVLSPLGKGVLGTGFDKLLIIAVLTSASASTQTTILPTARTTLSMAAWNSIPNAFGKMHKRYLTPSVSTLAMGGISIVWTVGLLLLSPLPSQNALEDSITAVGFPICFYYGFTGIACVVYFRRTLWAHLRNLAHAPLKSGWKIISLGIAPLAGALILFGVFYQAIVFYGNKVNDYSKPILGLTLPIWMGVGGMVLGLILLLISRPFFRAYFSRKLETAEPGILEEPIKP